jgi:hypothetical protein
VSASDIVFFIAGTDAGSPFSRSANIQTRADILANVYAKNGTIVMEDRVIGTGAFIAKDIFIGKKVQITLATAFTGLTKGADTNGGEESGEIPESFSLSQNYPNPFNPTTRIQYGLPTPGHVKLTIHNVLGQEVARLVDGNQDAGFHKVQWDGKNDRGGAVASGVYFYRLQAGDFVKTSKMVFLK